MGRPSAAPSTSLETVTAPAAGRLNALAVVGAGSWSVLNHLPQLAQTPGVEVVALMDASSERAEAVARQFGIPRSYSSVEELLAAEERLDGLVIASAHVAHFQNALPAVRAGLPCMIEKPMTATAEDARSLLEAAAVSGAELLVPCGWNFRPFSERARNLVQEGAIGKVEHIVCHMASSLEDLFAARENGESGTQAATWADPAKAGGYGWGQVSCPFVGTVRHIYCSTTALGSTA